jgi:branched-chain amino acid transport system permease protein
MSLFPEPVSLRSARFIATAVLILALVVVPPLTAASGETYYVTLASRMLVFALAASSLNLLLGYGGMMSFGHALYLGLGAYVAAILTFHGIGNGFIHLGVTALVCALVALVTGLISLRTSGIAFIMITLAFAQMFFFLATSLKYYGGDDGIALARRSDFSPLLSIQDNTPFYYLTLGVLLAALYLSWRLVHSRFGRVLRGASANAPRMRSLGFPVLRFQVVAYVISGCLCGIAGLFLANLARFASPTYMAWTVSGDLIVMVILGGVATIVGPMLGAILYVLLETVLAAYTQHWMVVLGPIILLVALLAKRGLYGSVLNLQVSLPITLRRSANTGEQQ